MIRGRLAVLAVFTVLFVCGDPANSYCGVRISGRRMQQFQRPNPQQSKQDAELQKALELAQQKQAAEEAAAERKKQDLIARARRTRHEKEAKDRADTIAKLKAAGSKTSSDGVKSTTMTTKTTTSPPAKK